MAEVRVHIYDMTIKGFNTAVQINKILRDGIGLGGIFHAAIQVYGEDEWSFGFCEEKEGTGVFNCPSGKNSSHTYRQSIVLGKTDFSNFKVNKILRELSIDWPGSSYDAFSKNSNHFCNAFCDLLGVPKLPGWVNRFAEAGDTATEVAGYTALRLHEAKADVISAGKGAYQLLSSVTSVPKFLNNNSNKGAGGSSGLQTSWFKNMITNKPPTISEAESQK